MLPSVECGRRLQGIEPAGATYFGRVEALDERERRDWSRQLTRFAIQHPNAIVHARLEFGRGFEVHVCRVERLVVEPQRAGRDGKASRNMLRSSWTIGIAALGQGAFGTRAARYLVPQNPCAT